MAALPSLLWPHWQAPHRAGQAAGELALGAASGSADNAACGDQLQLWVAHEGPHLLRVGFSGRGCSTVIATASFVCASLEGGTLESAGATWRAARLELTPHLAPQRRHALELIERALSLALAQVRERCHPGQPNGDSNFPE